jgi:hypothetical protein
MPAAAGNRSMTSDESGALNPGRPDGTGGTTATPCSARSRARTATMPTATATSGPGMRFEILPRASSPTTVAVARATVGPSASSSWVSADQTFSKKLSPVTGTPSTLPSWLAAITSPVPTLKPARTGREMKSPRNPNLKIPAASRMNPVTTARVAVAVA